MADITINQLTEQAPALSDVFPFSTTGVTPSTYKASLAQIKTGLAISWSDVSGKPSFATVATTGSYNDLSNTPPIPTNTGIGGAILFTSSTAWTVPAGVTKIKVYCIGAGGRAGNNNRGSTGGSSSITGIDIIGGGGGGARNTSDPGAGGAGSGALCISTNTGGSGVGTTAGTQPSQIFGKTAGKGAASGSSCGGGGAGGYAFGVATVTPGAALSINVGTQGGYSDCSGAQAGAGLVGIEW